MRTLEEVRNTPVGLLSEAEINMLDPEGQAFARNYQARKAKEAASQAMRRSEPEAMRSRCVAGIRLTVSTVGST